MSRTEALRVLNRETAGFACGIAWLPADVLDNVARQTGAATRAQAVAVAAASIAVDLAFVDAKVAEGRDTVDALHAADIAAVWTVDGVFTRVANALGWTEAIRQTAVEPGALAARLDEALHDALVLVREALRADADAVLLGDDLAGPSGPLLSPDFALDALMPCYQRIALEVRGAGLPAIFHSDGDIRMLMPALARAGFSAVHVASVGPDAFAASALAAHRVGLTALGGIAVQSLPEGAREAGERAAAVATSIGGVIVCDDGGITTMEEVAELGGAIDSARGAFRHPRA